MEEKILDSSKNEDEKTEKENFKDGNNSKEGNLPVSEKISEYNKLFSGYSGIEWDRMPDIELYMDQVVTFLDRHLGIYKLNEEDKIVTPSMINNYTKDRIVPRAESKKYSREHIALILIVVSLKKVLSMPDLTNLLKDFETNRDTKIEEFYNKFLQYQNNAISKSTSEIEAFLRERSISEESGSEIMKDLALELSVQSHINCILAEHILNIITNNEKNGKIK